MLRVGSTLPEHHAYLAQITVSHRIRVRVKLLALSNGAEVADLSPRLLDGQVDIDSTAETTRSATVTVDDPDHVLHLDSRGLGDGGIYGDRLVAITYGVFVEALNKWIDVPVFKGPVTGLARDGSSLTMTCLGMEHIAKATAWQPMSFKRGQDTVSVIKAILRDRAGERQFAFPSRGGRLPRNLALGRTTIPWTAATSLAKSIGRQLYYDGRGVCRLRRYPVGTVWTFRHGNNGSVLSEPDVTYDLSTLSNLVGVRGAKATRGNPQKTYAAVAPRGHPMSPWALGRNGVPRYLVTVEDVDSIRTRAAAKALAERRLEALLREGVQVTFDSLPIPHLDPLDPVNLVTSDTSMVFLVQQLSIPLLHTGVMSVGTNRRVTPNRKAVRL